MKRNPTVVRGLALVGIVTTAVALQACIGPTGGGSPTASVTTYHNNAHRDGNYPYETELTQAKVTPAEFGKIGSLPVDGLVYAQPLVAGNVMTDSGPHDLVIVATEHDTVYAFDGQTLEATPIWRNNFIGISVGKTATPGFPDQTAPCLPDQAPCGTLQVTDSQIPNISPEIGITATPVIDSTLGIVYVVAHSKDGYGYHLKLHALDLATGKEKPNSPVEIQGTYASTGDGSSGGGLNFQSPRHMPATAVTPAMNAPSQLSRAALALVPPPNGIKECEDDDSGWGDGRDAHNRRPRCGHASVMIGFSSFDDELPAHGWFFSYDTRSLKQQGIFVTTPGGGLGNIWMAGAAPAIDDDGSVYFSTGNGDSNNIVATDYDESIVKLGFNGGQFSVQDFFTPFNRVPLDDYDVEIGSAGVMLLPDQSGPYKHLLVQGGKGGTLYLLNRDTGFMGGRENQNGTRDVGIVQEMPAILSPENPNSFDTGLYATPTWWNGKVYVAAVQSHLQSFQLLSNGQFDTTPKDVANEFVAGRSAGTAISSNNEASGTGIIWLVDDSAYSYNGWNTNTLQIAGITNGPAVLYAYNPDNLGKPLYASNQTGGLDNAGNAVKFTVPTVAGGHVYVGTQTEVTVFGMLPAPRTLPPPTTQPEPPAKLSETGFFDASQFPKLVPAQGAGLINYNVNSQLWSDNAIKMRWIQLPAGQKIKFDPTQPWTFPVGTVMIKHFALSVYPPNTTATAGLTPKVVNLETRVLTYGKTGWSGVTYQWTQNQDEALVLPDGGSAEYWVPNPAQVGQAMQYAWHFPATTDCMSCHTQVAGYAIGVNTRQLNTTNTYNGASQNQLAYLNGLNLFTTNIGLPTQYDAYDSVNDPTKDGDPTKQARSYLATNCAFCHQPGGPTGVGMDFRYDTPVANMNVVDVAPTKGNGGVNNAFIVTPGSPGASVLYLRMDTTAPGRMPPLGSSLVDQAAVTAVGTWITDLASGTPAPMATVMEQARLQPAAQKYINGQRVIRYLPTPHN